MSGTVLLVSDEKYLRSDIMGGVQLCTREFIKYFELAGYQVKEFPVKPVISIIKRIKIKMGIDAYDHYDIKPYRSKLVDVLNSGRIKLVLFNQLDLAFWSAGLKEQVGTDVKFVGLSHGNESGDYLHDITRVNRPVFLQTWKLGKLLIKETNLFTNLLDGVIILSRQEEAINQWLGGNRLLYLPRLLEAGFLNWKPDEIKAGFVGTLDHLPNLLGIKHLANELQKNKFGFMLCVAGGPAAIGEQLANEYRFIRYEGPVSDAQLVEHVKTWSVLINPVFWYARGSSTKLAQAIKWGIPCITTPAGRRGYYLVDETIMASDNTPETFAKKLIKALNEKDYLFKLKEAAENNALNFNPDMYVKQLKEFLNTISSSKI